MRVSVALLAAVATIVASLPAAAEAPQGPDWFEGDYTFDFATLTDLEVTGALDLRRVTLEGGRYEADELRDAYRALRATGGSASAEEFVRSVEAALAASFRANLEAAFPGAVVAEPAADLDDASLAAPSGGDPNDPPVVFALATGVALDLSEFGFPSLDAATAQQVLDLGAQVTVPFNAFAEPGHHNDFRLVFPQGTVVAAASDAVRSGRETRFDLDNRHGTAPATEAVSVTLASTTAPPPGDTDGRIEIVVDIRDLDVSIADAAGGDFGLMLMEVSGSADLDTVEVTDEVAASMPEGIRFASITPDGLRTLLELGLVDEARLAEAGVSLTSEMGARLTDALGAAPTGLDGGFDLAALAERAQLTFRFRADVARPVAGAPDRAAALALYTIAQNLPLERVEGLDTTYRVILPEGIAVTDAASSDAEVSRHTRPDGRDEVVVTLAGDDGPQRATMEMQVAVTPTFVVNKFWPILLGALLVVVGVVALAAWGVVRARKK